MKFGYIFKEARGRATQVDYAERLGVTQTYLSQIETDKRRPSFDLLDKLAKESTQTVAAIVVKSIGEEDVTSGSLVYFGRIQNELVEYLT